MEDSQQHQHECHIGGTSLHRTLVIHGYRPDYGSYPTPYWNTTEGERYTMESPFVPREQMI